MTYEKIKQISILFRKRQEMNKDVLCVTSGEKGDGKSNSSMYVAEDYMLRFGLNCLDCNHEWIYTGKALKSDKDGYSVIKEHFTEPCPKCGSNNIGKVKKFNFEQYMGYDDIDVKNKIFDLPRMSPLIGDEMVRWALSEDWNKAENKENKKLMYQVRTKGIILFGNLPEFITLDGKYKNMANYWIRIMQRGDNNALAIFIRKSKGEIMDKWHLAEIQKYMGEYFEDTPIDIVESICQRLKSKVPTVYDYFYIPPVNREMFARYEEYRNKKVFDDKERTKVLVSQKDLAKVAAWNLTHRYNEFIAAVENLERSDLPTMKVLAEHIFSHPLNKEELANEKTIYGWIKQVEDNLFGNKEKSL